MHIVIPESILPASLDRLRERHTVHYDPTLVTRPGEMEVVRAGRIADAVEHAVCSAAGC